jgi:murein L,D-transpeptidase YafK
MGDVPNAQAGKANERVDDLRAEAIARLRALRERPNDDQVPRYLLQMPADQKHAVVVDTSRSRLYVYENNLKRIRLVNDFYISIGKQGAVKVREGDQKTPVGVYHVTSSVPKQKLTDFYGAGAFPINYPNDWDKRNGRNGHGIWLHGTPSNTYSRAPRASDGCVVLSNADLNLLADNLQLGKTAVVISERVEWRSGEEIVRERDEILAALERWRIDWESLDADKYLAHYSRDFNINGQNYSAWVTQKKTVNSGKSWIKINLTNLSVYRNPGKEDLVVVSFDQDYRSSNLSNVSRKQQYWLRENGRWRIVQESTVS